MTNKAIKFGNWLLKNADVSFDKDGLLVWLCKGRQYSTEGIYYLFELENKILK
jgi:hypothetical protein